jgi:dienelactone hydrolase
MYQPTSSREASVLKKPIVVAVFWVTISAAEASLAERITIPAPHVGDERGLSAQLFLPAKKTGDTKRAAVIALHGCGGVGAKGELNARHTMWKDWWLERGLIVVFPESFTSRGYDQICTQAFRERKITQDDRVQDVLATKKWLAARHDVDPEKLILWGWSHGGGTVLATLTDHVGAKLNPDATFAHAVAFYPGCSNVLASARPRALSSPLMLLIGKADDWTPAKPCVQWVEDLKKNKLPATIVTFDDAYHDFDNPSGKLRVRKDVPNGVNGKDAGVTVGPNPLAREAAKAQLDAMLKKAQLIAE